ncbi:hypothetical protein [Sporosarcina koreensis]|uniref:Lipoprotein n=1 Tax=Sporosarcina koreensis TaxID=334735 RepID=A0ABW0TWB9_9BACL
MRKVFYSQLVCQFLLLSVIAGCSSSADWNSAFVVWNGYMYEVSNEYVDETDEEIGQVTTYSDRERTYSGNFSNKYSKGTKFYSIKGINTDEAIAVEEGERYRKAINNGKYGE